MAGDRSAAAADLEHHLLRQDPEDAHEAREQQRGLQQTDRERGREIRQVLRVLVDALIRLFPISPAKLSR